MFRCYRWVWSSSLVIALAHLTATVALAQEKGAASAAVAPPGKVLAPGQASNQEIIDLLKKVIQKLEAQEAQQGRRPAIRLEKVPEQAAEQQAIRELEKARGELLKQLQTVRAQEQNKDAPKPESPELHKARAEVQAAEQRLQEAKARLAKVQGDHAAGWQVIKRQPGSPPPGASDYKPRVERSGAEWQVKPDPRIEELVKQAELIKPGTGPAVRRALQGGRFTVEPPGQTGAKPGSSDAKSGWRVETDKLVRDQAAKAIKQAPELRGQPAADARGQALERRLDALMREIEELRREIRKPR
jgi:hypothetical protein